MQGKGGLKWKIIKRKGKVMMNREREKILIYLFLTNEEIRNHIEAIKTIME